MDAVFAYLHFLAMLGLAACLMGESLLLSGRDVRAAIERLGRLDTACFVLLGLVSLSGLARLMVSSRVMMTLVETPAFWIKVLLFIVMTGLSFLPSRRYANWRHHVHMDAGWQIPEGELAVARRVTLIELALLCVLPMLAVIMVRGLRLAA